MLRTFFFIFFTSFCVSICSGERLSGVVEDQQHRPVGGAELVLYRAGSDAQSGISFQSDQDGHWLASDLATGDYLLTVSKANFQGITKNIHVSGDQELPPLSLELAGVNQVVQVTAQDSPQALREASKSLSVIDHDEIANRNDYSVAETLRTSPGLQILQSGGPGQLVTLRVRGLRPDATAVLIDGLRFRDSTTLQGDASSFVSSLNIVNPDRIEVLRGAGSSLYGTNAAGGTINIVSDEGGGRTHGDLQAEGGSLDLLRARGQIAGGLASNRLVYSAGLLHLNVLSGIDGQDAARSTALQSFARYNFNDRISISGRFWGSDDFAQLNASPNTDTIPPANIPASGVVPAIPGRTFTPDENDPDSRRASQFFDTAAIYRQILAPRLSWQASYHNTHTVRRYDNGPAGPGFFQPAADDQSRYRGDIHTVDTRLHADLAEWFTLTGGYEFEREIYADRLDNHLTDASRVFSETYARQDSHAAYFAAQAALLARRLQLSASGRVQVFRLSTPTFRAGAPAEAYTRELPDPPRALTGDFSAAYLLNRSGTKLRAHVGNAYRSPSLYERFGGGFFNDYFTGQPAYSPYGDPALAPDRYNSVDAGVDQYLWGERLLLSATYFYTRIVHVSAFDFSEFHVDPATDPYGRSSGYYNGPGGISRGTEVALRARPYRQVSLSASYTYAHSNSDLDNGVVGFRRNFGVPDHVFGFVATNQWTPRLDTTVDLYKYSDNYAALFAITQSRAYRFPGFTKTGLVVGYRIWQNDLRSLRLYGRADNIFDRNYTEAGFRAAGATFVAGLGYAF